MPGSNEKKLLIFLSHASEDKSPVRELCERLKADGFDPWLDEERLLPGMNWNMEIENALRASDVILLCFSELSIQKEGYIQREYKRAMRYQEEKPDGTIYIIPVRLDRCDLPNFTSDLQFVDFPDGYDRLVVSLNLRSGKLASVPPIPAQKEAKFAFSATRTSEIRENVRDKNTQEVEISEQSRTINVTTSPREVLGTIHLSTLKELEIHQSSLRMYVQGYLRLSQRRDECDMAKSILVEKGIDKIKEGESLDWSDLREISSSLSSASMDEVLPSDLMFGDFKTRAIKLIPEMEELEKLDKLFQTVSPTKVEKIDRALNKALGHLDKSISTIKPLIERCGRSIQREIDHIEVLINGIVRSQKAQELRTAEEYSTTIDGDRTSRAKVEIGRSSFERIGSNATPRSNLSN